MWDNLLYVFGLNIGFVLVVGAGIYLASLFPVFSIPWLIAVAFGIVLLNFYTGAVSLAARDFSDYKMPALKEFFGYFKETWKRALVISVITIIQVYIVLFAFPFYLQRGLLGYAALSVIFWVSVIWMISSQYYFPIGARLDKNVRKILRKCFIMFFDNTIFSLVLALGTLLITAASGFTAFMIPGLTSVLIWHQVGFKLRLLKYDYLEENPEADRKKIPWDALLIDDKDRVGHRSLRGMIFPWKE